MPGAGGAQRALVVQGAAVAAWSVPAPLLAAAPVVAGRVETTEAERPFYGASTVFGPMGDLLAEGPEGKGPALIPVTLDLSEVERHGVRYTFFRDRRPELYASLAESARRVH